MRLACAVSVGLLAACGTHDDHDDQIDCSTVTTDDEFVVGLEKVGDLGNLNFQMMSADPAPPQRGDNTWVFQINAMQSGVVGAPVDGAFVAATPFMPEHGHGSPLRVEVTPAGAAGQYTLSPVNMWMPGVWETTIEVETTAASDLVIYRFCIE